MQFIKVMAHLDAIFDLADRSDQRKQVRVGLFGLIIANGFEVFEEGEVFIPNEGYS